MAAPSLVEKDKRLISACGLVASACTMPRGRLATNADAAWLVAAGAAQESAGPSIHRRH